MLIDFFPLPALLGLAALLVLLPLVWWRKRRAAYLLAFVVFWLYLLFLAGLTLFPLRTPLNGEARRSVAEILERVNLTPLFLTRAYSLSRFLRSEMFANVLLTVPFGLLLPALLRVRWWMALFIAFGIGAMIELTQLALSLYVGMTFRVTDITDVIMNAAGFLIGYLLNRAIAWLLHPRQKNPHHE